MTQVTLQDKIRGLSREIYDEMQQWKERLIEAGIERADADGASCCDEIIDECRASLTELANVFDENDVERVPFLLLRNVVYGTTEVSIPEMQRGMQRLEDALRKHLPPEEFDEFGDDEAEGDI